MVHCAAVVAGFVVQSEKLAHAIHIRTAVQKRRGWRPVPSVDAEGDYNEWGYKEPHVRADCREDLAKVLAGWMDDTILRARDTETRELSLLGQLFEKLEYKDFDWRDTRAYKHLKFLSLLEVALVKAGDLEAWKLRGKRG